MGTIIKSDEAEFWPSRHLYNLDSPIAPTGVWFLERDGTGIGRRNLANIDNVPAALVGEPVPSAGFTTCGESGSGTPNNGFQTDVMETAELTALLIYRASDALAASATRPLLLGNYNFDAAPRGFGIGVQSATETFVFASYDGSLERFPLFNGQANTGWQAIAVVVDQGVGLRLYNLTTGADRFDALTTARALADRPLRIGIGYGGFSGECDLAFAAFVPGVLTRAECVKAMAQPRLYLAEQIGIAA